MLTGHRGAGITAIIATPLAVLLAVAGAAAQELEPRSYSPSPAGTTFIVVSATRSTGGVFTDPSIPFTDVTATLTILGLAVGHTFAIAGKQTLLLGAMPVTWGTASGSIGEDRRSAHRSGLADPRIRLSMILAGSPARSRADFAGAPRRPILASSVTVVPPVGQYDSSKLINLGSHRWAFKPEMGVSVPLDRWTLDAYAGVWLFTANETFYPGSSRREQDPILALQWHVSYTLARRSWLAVNATWYSGGRTTLDGVDKGDLLRNTRLGATWAQPVNARQSFKVSYNAGATTRRGADFRTVTAAWQFAF
ncbi:MAG: transporter [Vicinamibacterales bacterium]